MHFDYIRLRARIREKLGSDVVFCGKAGDQQDVFVSAAE